MYDCQTGPGLSRRSFLGGSMAFASWAYGTPFSYAAQGRDPRLVFINLKGGLDGISMLAPTGDPSYEAARGGLILPNTGPDKGFVLDSYFTLNPHMPVLARLFGAGDALLFHAVATPYRSRSHFDGQDVLESGLPGVATAESGWMNRLLGFLPRGDLLQQPLGLSTGSKIPLVLRGSEDVINWMPAGFKEADTSLAEHLYELYTHSDPSLAYRLRDALKMRSILGSEAAFEKMVQESTHGTSKGKGGKYRAFAVAAGKLLAEQSGPRIASISISGWDTHVAEGPLDGRLAKLLSSLDGVIDGLQSELRTVWDQTVIVIATEFGRTVAMNGTAGTDHGTGTCAIAVGGALKGGRVIADWPGLGVKNLYEQRDLMPTTDLRSILMGLISEHLDIHRRHLVNTVFPETANLPILEDMIAL